jgi:hypothetical protein
VSRRGDALAAEYVAVVLGCLPSVQKSAGTRDLLMAACTPLCEAINAKGKGAKKRTRELREVQKTLAAIAYTADPRGDGAVAGWRVGVKERA